MAAAYFPSEPGLGWEDLSLSGAQTAATCFHPFEVFGGAGGIFHGKKESIGGVE